MTIAPTSDRTPLGEARAYLRQKWQDGATCPCCGQAVKLYRRTINATMAASMIILHGQCGREYGHIPTLSSQLAGWRGGEESKLRYWGLLEEETERRDDGGRAGYWRLTELGQRFVLGQARVARYALVYNGRCYGLDGPPIGIEDALRDKFNYRELMSR